jgi:nitric oxide reductase NorD protein
MPGSRPSTKRGRGQAGTAETLGVDEATTGPGRFELLASAIAGRSVAITATESGGRAWTDGTTIFVDAAAAPTEQLASLAVQSALLGSGSLDGEIVTSLVRRPALARRYLAVEGHRALSAQEHLLPRRVRGLIDRSVAVTTDSPARSLAIAAGRGHREAPPRVFGEIRPRRLERLDGAGGHEALADSHEARRDEGAAASELDREDEESDAAFDLFSSPVGGGAGLGKWLQQLFREGRSTGAGPAGADSVTHWSRRSEKVAAVAASSASRGPVPEGADWTQRGAFTYPEWDEGRHRYKADWCTVVEGEPTPGELAPGVASLAASLRRPLARLGMDLERERRRPQGDDIDIDATVEARVQLEAGSPPDEYVYVDAVRKRRDLAVLLLLDVSGSAGETGLTGEPVHRHQQAAAGALMLALHEMGDRVALYGFRSQGRSAVHVPPVKRFGEEPDARVLLRLGGLVPGAYTRLGAAIRHATAILEQEAGTSRRLLVVLSDGLAYDHGYERAYGEADARRALAEARRVGVGTLCLSIGAGTDARQLRSVFGVAAHAAVPRVEDLPLVIGPLFRSSLRAAELRRRVSQRRTRTRERLEIERKAG